LHLVILNFPVTKADLKQIDIFIYNTNIL